MKRWKHRPEGSTWGDWGDDDQLGRLNLITPKKVLEGIAEVKEGLSFCLSLPLDLPGGNVLNARRLPPVLSPTGDENGWRFNFLTNTINPLFMDVACDDRVILTLQYSTQWDTLAHVGCLFDADGDGVPEPLFYNGFKAGSDVVGPQPDAGRDGCGHLSYAHKLGVENMAAKAIQGRAVLVDLEKHFGRDHNYVDYDDFRRVLDADRVVVEPGDMLLLYTGFSDEIVRMDKKVDPARAHAMCSVLDGRDKRLLQWITDSQISALIADNYGVEAVPARPGPDDAGHPSLPLHNHCLFKLGLNLGEIWWLKDLALWLRDNKRSRFLLTAPPLRLPGAVGSPATPRGDSLTTSMATSFPAFVAGRLGTDRFSLLDVGCSGGIDPQWRAFEPHLRGIGIDASVTECERLTAAERNPDLAYIASFVSRSADVPVDHSQGPAAPLIMRMRDRLSFMRTRELREERLKRASTQEQLRHNAWEMTGLADPTRPIVVPDLLAQRDWTDLDYLKIDIDGGDFEILQSFEGRFDALGVIAAQLEVNFIGTEQPDEHTFHNTDRFMRRHGFDLFRLDVRTCSDRALPARYIWPTPAETVSGRPFQGEAYYARDVLAPHRAVASAGLSAAKFAKLAAVFSVWDVPDAAADLLVNRRDVLASLLDIDAGLNLLAAQTQADRRRRPLSYRDYLATFEADAASFYRPEGPIPLRERLAAAWRGYWHPREKRR